MTASLTSTIVRAETDDQIQSTFAVMHQLRPHIAADDYLQTVRRMERTDGFRLASSVEHDADEEGSPPSGIVRAVAGFRTIEMLYCGHILVVDDLVTDEAARSGGHGKRLLDWLRAEARTLGCTQVHLDSGVWRPDAHRFYFREGFHILGFHFVVDVQAPG